MSNENKARLAHEVLDGLSEGRILSRENEQLLRRFLPELPKQKTLEEITLDVLDALAGVSGNDWGVNSYAQNVSIEDWLCELHTQLKGLKDTPATVPALPAGMRLADHENFGRVVVSPGVGIDRCHEIFYLDPGMSSGTDISEVEPDSLTFVDAEPAKPAHPEFLDSPEDYKLAPNGTIVVYEKSLPWVKRGGSWLSAIADAKNSSDEMGATPRRALRWGWGE